MIHNEIVRLDDLNYNYVLDETKNWILILILVFILITNSIGITRLTGFVEQLHPKSDYRGALDSRSSCITLIIV